MKKLLSYTFLCFSTLLSFSANAKNPLIYHYDNPHGGWTVFDASQVKINGLIAFTGGNNRQELIDAFGPPDQIHDGRLPPEDQCCTPFDNSEEFTQEQYQYGETLFNIGVHGSYTVARLDLRSGQFFLITTDGQRFDHKTTEAQMQASYPTPRNTFSAMWPGESDDSALVDFDFDKKGQLASIFYRCTC